MPMLDAPEFALFERAGRPRLAVPGECIYRRGDLGNSMFVVVQGTVELEFGDGLPVQSMGRHACFGALGLLVGDHARRANASALGSTILVEVGHDALDRLAGSDPLLLVGFMRRVLSDVVLRDQDLIRQLRSRNGELQDSLDALGTAVRRIDRAPPVRS